MKKQLLNLAMLLLVLLMGGGASAQTISWSYQKDGTYSANEELSTSTNVASVTLGNGTWQVYTTNYQGIYSEDPTFENNIPTKGSYLVIKPKKKSKFILKTGTNSNYTSHLVEESDPTNNIGYARPRYNAELTFDNLEEGKTYYFWGDSYKSATNAFLHVRLQSFTLTTYETYTVTHVLADGTKISDDAEYSVLYGSTITASDEDMAKIVYNGKNYVYESGNISKTIEGTETIKLVYKEADLSHATINYVDEDNEQIKQSVTKQVAIGQTFSASEEEIADFFNEDKSNKYVYKEGNKTLNVVEDESNNVINLVYKKFTLTDYKVIAKDGENIIGTIAEGKDYLDGAYSVSISKYWSNSGNWYSIESPYSKAITSATTNINVSKADIYFFAEAEKMSNNIGASSNNNLSNCAQSSIKGGTISELIELPAGKYKLTAYLVERGDRGIYFRDMDNSDNQTNKLCQLDVNRNSAAKEYSTELVIKGNTRVGISGFTTEKNSTNQSAPFDYVYIVKTGDVLPLSTAADYTLSTYAPATDVDLTNEDGVEFYAAKVNGTSVALTKVEGKVKAGTGLLVKNTNSVESVTLAIATDGQTVADNELIGVTADMTAADFEGKNAYILVSDTQFQKIGSGTEGTLAKGKAYLLAGTTAGARLLTIGNPTAINGVAEKAAEAADTIYNMQGMRVDNAAASGLYIINGKKYIKK